MYQNIEIEMVSKNFIVPPLFLLNPPRTGMNNISNTWWSDPPPHLPPPRPSAPGWRLIMTADRLDPRPAGTHTDNDKNTAAAAGRIMYK